MKRAVLLLAPMLASCATPQAQPPSYRAVGTQPFWSLTIGSQEMIFTQPEEAPVRQFTPKVIVGFAGEIYKTARIDVNIVHVRCSDGMSDRACADKVQVTVDGHRFNGCGGL